MEREEILQKVKSARDGDEFKNYVIGNASKYIVFVGLLIVWFSFGILEFITNKSVIVSFDEYTVPLSTVWAFFGCLFYSFYFGYTYVYLKEKKRLLFCILFAVAWIIGTSRILFF